MRLTTVFLLGEADVATIAPFGTFCVPSILISGVFDVSGTAVSCKQEFVFLPVPFGIACLTVDPTWSFLFKKSRKKAFPTGAPCKFISVPCTASPVNIKCLFRLCSTLFPPFPARLSLQINAETQTKKGGVKKR